MDTTTPSPHAPALIEGDRTLTWREFIATRNRLAHALAGLGLSAGEHAIVYAPNSANYLIASAAVRAVGAIAVPMNHRLVTDEVAYIIDDSDAALVLVGDPFLATDRCSRPRGRRTPRGRRCARPTAGAHVRW